MPENRVIYAEKILIFKYAQNERQDLLNSKDFGRWVLSGGGWPTNRY
jgi:hypothetical protein